MKDNDITLYSNDGIPLISVPRLCPYCHQSHIQFETRTQATSFQAVMYLTCPFCGTSSAPYEFNTESSVVAAQYKVMEQWLRQIAILPTFMLLCSGDETFLKGTAPITVVTTPQGADYKFLVENKEGRVFMVDPDDIDPEPNDRIKEILKH